MGHTVEAKCLDCGHKFELDQGGGFKFHLLRCDSCGMTKAVGFDAHPGVRSVIRRGLRKRGLAYCMTGPICFVFVN